MTLTSTQIGAIGENLLINAVMKASDGRLSPFQPLADDDGIDVLFFDKDSGKSVAIQLKCRTNTINKRGKKKDGTKERGNTCHFDVRKATFNVSRKTYLIAALLNSDKTKIECSWFMSMEEFQRVANVKKDVLNITPNKSERSVDRYSGFRFHSDADLMKRIIDICED